MGYFDQEEDRCARQGANVAKTGDAIRPVRDAYAGMDHRAVLETLPEDLRVRLVARSDRTGLRHLVVFLGALGATGAGIGFGIPFWPLLLLPHGILLVFLFTLSHECTHQTPFRTPWINEAVGHAIAPILILPFVWFRYFHLAHHRYTNDPSRDPELADAGRPDSWRDWLIYLSGWRYWRVSVLRLWANARGHLDAPYLPERRKRAMQREAQVMLAVYGLVAVSLCFSSALFWLWILPVLLGQPFLRAYLLRNTGCARRWPICWKTHGRRLPRALSGFWPGTCPIMPNITPFRPCRSTICPPCTLNWRRI